MNYLKSTIKNIYEKVIEDEYLQTLTQNEVYLIINMTNRRRLSSSHKDPRKMSLSAQQIQLQLFTKIQQIGNVTPQRLFRVFGPEPNISIVNGKLKELEENLGQICVVMQDNFSKYEKKLNMAIQNIDHMKSLYMAKKNSMQLRTKLKSLQQTSQKSKRIAYLNIKATNIKKLLKTLTQIPKLKQMSLTQLKSINIQTIKSKPTLSSLKCLSGLQKFINHAVSYQLSTVLQKLKQCLVNKFNQLEYENALKDFIIAQHQSIKYQSLLMKIVQNQIRYIQNQEKYLISCRNADADVDGDGGNTNKWVLEICQCYVRFLINLHQVFKWHRINQKDQKWEHLRKGFYGISIQIDINKIMTKIISVIDQCLKDIVLQTLYQTDNATQYLQLLYLILRLSQITYTFSGIYLNQTLKESTEFIIKKLHKLKQRASNQLEQTFKLQQRNSWNRLPVIDTYSHQPIDKCLYQIYMHSKSQEYPRVLAVVQQARDMLRGVKVQIGAVGGGVGGLVGMWGLPWNVGFDDVVVRESNGVTNKNVNNTSAPQQKIKFFQHEQVSQTTSDSTPVSTRPEWQSQTWQIQPTQFHKAQKFEKNKLLVTLKLKPIQLPHLPSSSPLPFKAIICQYSLTILKYMEMFCKYCFYFPVEPIFSYSLQNIRLMIEYYIYQIFTTFLSQNIKTVFYEKCENMQTQQQRYHKQRFHYTYPNISNFINKFKQTHKITAREQLQQSPSTSSNHVRHSNSISYSSPNIPVSSSVGPSLGSSTNLGGNDFGVNLAKENLMVRSRVVALQSLLYVVQYYQHVCNIMGLINNQKVTNNTDPDTTHTPTTTSPTSLHNLHPSSHQTHKNSYILYLTLYNELSQLLYTDYIPKLCNLKNTQSLIQSIKWNDSQYPLQEYVQVFGKNCTQFYYKMNSNNKGERLYGVYWRTQLTTIMKSFIMIFKPGKTSTTTTPKHKLQHFIDNLYEVINQVPKDKSYIRIPYQKMKAIFPILMQNRWESAFQLLKLSLSKYEFIYAVEMGLGLISESCCYMSNQDVEDRKKIIQQWIQANLIMGKNNGNLNGEKTEK